MVSSGGVQSIWKRNDLNTLDKRLKALERNVSENVIILTESQLKELEKQKSKRRSSLRDRNRIFMVFLEIKTHTMLEISKGLVKVYQQSFIDTCSRVADAKLYTEKTAITAADMLNDRVVPFFDGHGIPLLQILTDRGTEYYGSLENHAFELFLSIEGIDHSKTKAYTPQSKGICE